MADRLTQLQDCYDDWLNQIYATVRYLYTRHAYVPIEGQPDMNPHSANSANPAATNGVANGDGQGQNGSNEVGANADVEEDTADPPELFRSNKLELARDLIIKEHQIEYLISVLPGIGNSEADQDGRIQALEVELRQVEEERNIALQDREKMLQLLGDLASKCKRVY